MGSRHCPEVTAGSCPLVDGADVVYANLPWHDTTSWDVLHAHRSHCPDTPVVVEICKPQVVRFADDLAGCRVVHVPSGKATMLAAIRDSLGATTGS